MLSRTWKHRTKILIVDHDEQNLDAMAVMLGSLGHKVVVRQDGETALDALASDPSIELLITEIFLDGRLDGPELVQLANEAHPGIAAIYSTRYSPTFLLDSEAPRDRPLIRKPWQRGELDAIVSEALSSHAAERHDASAA
jgi:DNA-binding NtrC family response regulator